MGKSYQKNKVELRSEQSPNGPLVKKLTWVLGALTLCVYIMTLYPNVSGGDSGELIAVAHTLGIAHPPGYPLFTLLGKAFTWIPYGSPAWRVNLLSAVCDTGAAIFLLLTVASLTLNPWAGFLAGGLFAFSPLVWTYAVQAEVFPLNHLICTIMIYWALRYSQTNIRRYAYLAVLFFGLGLSNHHTILFVGGPMVLWILWIGHSDLLQRKTFGRFLLSFCAGLLFYFYLPLAALRHPKIMWGDLLSWSGFFTHILRREYGSFSLGSIGFGQGKTDLFKGLSFYFFQIPKETLYFGFMFAIYGIVQGLRSERMRGFVGLTLSCFTLYLIVFHALANFPVEKSFYTGIYERFWQLGNLFIFIWVGIGFSFLVKKIRLPHFWMSGVSLGGVLLGILFHYQSQDQHRSYLFYNFGKFILKSLPPNALFLSSGDIYTNTTRYLQESENFRTDVRIIDRVLMSYPWMREQIKDHFSDVEFPGLYYRYVNSGTGGFTLSEFLSANKIKFPLFVCNIDKIEDQKWVEAFDSWPYGLVNWYFPKDVPFDLEKYLRDTDQLNASIDFNSLPKTELTTWELTIRDEYWEAEHRRGRKLLSYGIQTENPKALNASVRILQNLLERHPFPPATLYKNLGNAYLRLSAFEPEAIHGMVVNWKKYLELNEPDSDLEVIRKTVHDHSQ